MLIAVFIILGLVGRMLESVLKFAFLEWVNKLAGVLFSIMKLVLILGLLITAFSSFNSTLELVKPEVIADSKLYQPLKDIADAIFPYIKNMLSELAYGKNNTLRDLHCALLCCTC